MSIPTFATQKKAWASPPIDDIGYLPSDDLLEMDDGQFKTLMRRMEDARYQGWRNQDNRWIETLRIDETANMRVLDYGCGVGVEALQYTPNNQVWVADIVPANIKVAERLFDLAGQKLEGSYLIQGSPPFMSPAGQKFDVIHCSGVLHHIPNVQPIVKRMASWLDDQGELRLMVYSDEAWRRATREEPPEEVTEHPQFMEYVRYWDAVGDYADWYSCRKLVDKFGEWFEVEECLPITAGGEYLGAILRKR